MSDLYEHNISFLGEKIDQLQKKYVTADYLLQEINTYVITHKSEIGKEFFDWFLRNIEKYQKLE